MSKETIEVDPEAAELFHDYKEEYEKFSGEDKTDTGYLLRLLNHDADRMVNFVKIKEFDLK